VHVSVVLEDVGQEEINLTPRRKGAKADLQLKFGLAIGWRVVTLQVIGP
jgi:hypothetical protein